MLQFASTHFELNYIMQFISIFTYSILLFISSIFIWLIVKKQLF